MTDAATLTRALGGKWYGRYGLAFCPAHDNRRTPALSLADGTEGRLLATCHAGCSFAAIANALRGLGMSEAPFFIVSENPADDAARWAKEKAQAEKRAAQAHRLWQEALPIAGTLAERYLRGRDITCPMPPTLRFHPRCWHTTAQRLRALMALVCKRRCKTRPR